MFSINTVTIVLSTSFLTINLLSGAEVVAALGVTLDVPDGWSHEVSNGVLILRNYPNDKILPQSQLPEKGVDILLQLANNWSESGTLEAALYQSIRRIGHEAKVGVAWITNNKAVIRLTYDIQYAPEADQRAVEYYFAADRPFVGSLYCRIDDEKCPIGYEPVLRQFIRSILRVRHSKKN